MLREFVNRYRECMNRSNVEKLCLEMSERGLSLKAINSILETFNQVSKYEVKWYRFDGDILSTFVLKSDTSLKIESSQDSLDEVDFDNKIDYKMATLFAVSPYLIKSVLQSVSQPMMFIEETKNIIEFMREILDISDSELSLALRSIRVITPNYVGGVKIVIQRDGSINLITPMGDIRDRGILVDDITLNFENNTVARVNAFA